MKTKTWQAPRRKRHDVRKKSGRRKLDKLELGGAILDEKRIRKSMDSGGSAGVHGLLGDSVRIAGRERIRPLLEIRAEGARGRKPKGFKVRPGGVYTAVLHCRSGVVRVTVYNESRFDSVRVR